MGLGDLMRAAESGGDPNARNPNSSASGPDQFINSTWLATIKAARPDIAQGQSDQALLTLKTDSQLSGEMRDYYTNQNSGILSKAGLPVTPGTQYLAHFAGPQGAVGILNADPGQPAGAVLGAGVVRANPFLANMTAGDLAAWADRKMGGGGNSPMSLAGPRAGAGARPAAPSIASPQQPQGQQVAAAASPAVDLNALAAVPALQNLLPPRPNVFGLRTAPFSLRG